jgi:hypothetical protein
MLRLLYFAAVPRVITPLLRSCADSLAADSAAIVGTKQTVSIVARYARRSIDTKVNDPTSACQAVLSAYLAACRLSHGYPGCPQK